MADLGYAPHIPGRMAMVMQGSCTVNGSTDQSVVCRIASEKCRNLQYTCSNYAVVDYQCSSLDKFADLGALVVSAEPPSVQAELAKQHGGSDTSTITQVLKSNIQSACGTTATAQQAVENTLQCTNSANVIMNVLNTMDATAACVTLQVASLVATARQGLVSPKDSTPPLTNPATIGIILIGGALLGVGIMVAVWKL
jgi:hypothetical protein